MRQFTWENVQLRYLEINSLNNEEIFNILSSLSPEASPYLASFPLPVELGALTNIDNQAYLCRTDVSDQGNIVTNTFCSKKIFIEKEERTRDEIGSDAINEFGWENYDEFIFIKKNTLNALTMCVLTKKPQY